MKSQRLLLGLGLLAPFLLGGCEQLQEVIDVLRGNHRPEQPPPRACTAIGCSDGLNVIVRPRAGAFAQGRHEVTMVVEGVPTRICTFDFPVPGGEGAVGVGVCEGAIFLTVAPVMTCTSMTSGEVVSQTCKPVPGQFEERLQFPGHVRSIHLVQKVGGAVYLDRATDDVRYDEVYPNGLQCGPVCKQASVEWTF